MINNYYKYISFFIIIYILLIIHYKYKHKFWSIQPVSHYSKIILTEGIITDCIEKPIKSQNSDLNLVIDTGLTEYINNITDFLNCNYYQTKLYKNHYTFKQLLSIFNKNYFHYCIIKEREKVCGFISSQIYKINIKNKIVDISYVDYLCIDTAYRSKKLAPLLISNIRYINNLNDIKSFIFKIEGTPLPFNYLTRLTYYQLDLTNINLVNNELENIYLIDEKDIDKTYLYVNNYWYEKSYTIFPIYSKEEFYQKYKNFKGNSKLSYIEKYNENIIGFATFSIQWINRNNQKYLGVELIYILSSKDLLKFFKNLLILLKKNLIIYYV